MVLAVMLAAAVFTAKNTEIVVESGAPPTVRFAAHELKNFLGKTFGGKVLMTTGDPTAGKLHIFLGATERSTAAGIDVEKIATDGFAIVCKGDDVFIAGKDDPAIDPADRVRRPSWGAHCFDHGTLNGVYEFLERAAGVRFYFPGDLGTCTVHKDSIRMRDGRLVSEPDLTTRTWSLYSDGAWFAGKERVQLCHPMKSLNIFRLRASTKDYGCCHGLNGFQYVERFGETHPEYFAIDEKGESMIEGKGWRRGHLCLSSGIRDEIYKDCLSYLKGEDASVRGIRYRYDMNRYGWNYNTTPRYIDLMPQDGGAICHCSKCKARWRKGGRKYPMTEIVWGLLTEVAERLAADGYEPTFTMMSYADYNDLPECPLPKNLKVMVAKTGPWANNLPGSVEKDDTFFAKWEQRLGGKPWIWTYPNRDDCNGLNLEGVPAWAPRAWAKYYQGVSGHVFGFFAESETPRAIDNLMGYYMLSKIGWRKNVDTDAIMDEFYERMFGKAAADMKLALEFVEDKFTKEVAGSMRMTDIGPAANVPGEYAVWCEIYSAAETARLGGYFDAAEAKVDEDSLEARRIALFRTWMYEPLKKTGDAYRETTDVKTWSKWNREHGKENLFEGSVWKPGEGAFDSKVRFAGHDSIRLTATKARSTVHAYGSVRLKRSTRYRFSFFVKTENIEPLTRGGGVGPMLSSGEWSIVFPETYNFLSGTVPWVRQAFEFNTPNDLPIGPVSVLLRIRSAAGTAWFDEVRMDELGPASASLSMKEMKTRD